MSAATQFQADANTTTDGPTTTVGAIPTHTLPPTGSSDTTILAVGVAALLVGGALLLAGRRGSEA